MQNLRSTSNKVVNKTHVQCVIAFDFVKPEATQHPPLFFPMVPGLPGDGQTSYGCDQLACCSKSAINVGYLSLLQLFALGEKR